VKKFLCTAVLAVIGSWVFAQERIAVFPFQVLENAVTHNESYQLYQAFSNAFRNRSSGGLTVVPRQDVDRLINTEAAFQLTEFSAQEKTAEMMRVQNATQILSGTIGKMGNSITIVVSLYSYPKLEQLVGGGQKRVASETELFDKIPELVQEMWDAIEKERIEKERIEKERIEKERIEKERIEKERIEKEREKEREKDKGSDSGSRSSSLDARLNTIGISVGSSFAAPFVIISAHGTIAPIRHAFLEIGFDFGLLSGDLDVSFYSMYPFAHLAFFLPFSENVGSYIGAGAGYMMVRYTFPEGEYSENIFAADIVAGFNILDMFDISYTLRTNFSGISNKISVGLTYRFK
jgi:hypothetical protein